MHKTQDHASGSVVRPLISTGSIDGKDCAMTRCEAASQPIHQAMAASAKPARRTRKQLMALAMASAALIGMPAQAASCGAGQAGTSKCSVRKRGKCGGKCGGGGKCGMGASMGKCGMGASAGKCGMGAPAAKGGKCGMGAAPAAASGGKCSAGAAQAPAPGAAPSQTSSGKCGAK